MVNKTRTKHGCDAVVLKKACRRRKLSRLQAFFNTTLLFQSPSSRISFWISRPAARASWSMPRMRAIFLP